MNFWTNFKRHPLLWAFSTLLFFMSAQTQVKAAELNLIQNQFPINLGLYLDVYEDPSSELTIDDIRRIALGWERSSQSIPTLGFSPSSFWFRLTLTGEQLNQEDLVLSVDAPSLDKIEFYIKANDRELEIHLAGDSVPVSLQTIAQRNPTIPINTSSFSNEVEIWIKVKSQSSIELPILLSTQKLLLQQQQSELAFLGAFFVLFCLSFAACGIAYYYIRDRQFLGYALLFGSGIVFFLALTGMGKLWFWSETIELNNRLTYASGTWLIISSCILGQSLNVQSRFKDLAIVILRFISLAMLPTCLYFLFIPFDLITSGSIQTLIWIGLLVIVIVLAIAAIAASQGSRVAVYIVASWTLLILSYFALLSYKLDVFEKSSATTLFAETLVVLAGVTILLSLAEFIKIKNEEFLLSRLEARAKSDFLRNVSKEFLTPVHLILANSKRLQLSQDSSANDITAQSTQTVIKQSEHLHSLINDLLEMAEIESDHFEPEFELVEVTQLLADIHNTMLPAALEKDLVFDTQFASANLLVQTDKSRLQHVLLNLVTNAIKFTDKGSIGLGFKAVYFKSRLAVEIFVKDTGAGISEEFKARMFDDFSHSEEHSEINPTNTGLGMVIVKRIIEKLGGEIHVESKQNQGSEFFIRLPLRTNKQ